MSSLFRRSGPWRGLMAAAMAVVLALALLPADGSAQVVTNTLSIKLNAIGPNAGAVSGTVLNVPRNVEGAVVTLTLRNGQIASQIVGAANGWSFYFTNVPGDGWQDLKVTDVSTSSPGYVAAGASVPAYVFTYPYVGNAYRSYTALTGYPTYFYGPSAYSRVVSPGTYYYSTVPAYLAGYTYNATCVTCSSMVYPTTTGFSAYGSGYYYRNGQYYFYPLSSTASTYYLTDTNSVFRTYATGYNTTYYYTPTSYTSGYYLNPGHYFTYNYGSGPLRIQ